MERLKEENKLQKQRDSEEKASEELIKAIMQDEVFQMKQQAKRLRLDEVFARNLAKDIKSANCLTPRLNHKDNSRRSMISYTSRKHNQLDANVSKTKAVNLKLTHFFTFDMNTNEANKTNLRDVNVCNDDESNDSIDKEFGYFKPIDRIDPSTSKVVLAVRVPVKVNKSPVIIMR